MHTIRKATLIATCLAGACVPNIVRPAYGSDFTAFTEDENICRQAGAAAIQGATGPMAAQRYDVAHGQCMVAKGRRRMMRAYGNAAPPGAAYPPGNPHSFDFPDAFYSIPYATPGYGYDGYSY